MTPMTNKLIQQATRKDYLIERHNEAIKQIVSFDIDIRVLEGVDSGLIVGHKELSPNSHKEISAGEMLQQSIEKRAQVQKRLNAIEALLAQE